MCLWCFLWVNLCQSDIRNWCSVQWPLFSVTYVVIQFYPAFFAHFYSTKSSNLILADTSCHACPNLPNPPKQLSCIFSMIYFLPYPTISDRHTLHNPPLEHDQKHTKFRPKHTHQPGKIIHKEHQPGCWCAWPFPYLPGCWGPNIYALVTCIAWVLPLTHFPFYGFIQPPG